MRNNLSTKPNVSPRNHPPIPSLISDIPLHYSTTLAHSYKVSGTVISVRLRKSHVSFIRNTMLTQSETPLVSSTANYISALPTEDTQYVLIDAGI